MTRLHVPVALRWADLDAYAHVNNVDMLRLLEDARITAFWVHPEAELGESWPTAVLHAGPHADAHTLVARQEIEYLRPLAFTRIPVRVEMWIGHLGGASLDVCYEVHDGAARLERTGPGSGGEPYARASTTIVLVDAATSRPRRITEEQRAAWEPFVEAPIPFRRRS
ncbi:thioesterase superfamily protein [Beutenbergia cavernae DSM 12333]|uniref:Thioesterase superfamily protein n=1 Tax=Beutenbergia cavernae (strain ATCC BAA-8 / DSM 12333 / CCUG 43141 / JCM 11478 / NBRC 16432 / NCIMB 13614 / HKI 0122) TaxID=471853 RepID=C5BXK1_BEUC1|nr:thioesterase family protein [Beutenbergia cavernae]ACQ80884.1 thioesterase superfamily protein [Beutenbergia cavernae DSM 12333]